MVNKKVVIICTIIAIIVTTIIVAIEVKKFREQDFGGDEETATIPQNVIQNPVENEIEENNTEENQNAEVENTNTEETPIEENDLPNSSYQGEEETKEDETTSQDYNSKAMELVKKEWGEDDTVYFTIDNQSENIFNISVRSKETTQTLAEYEVNVIDETVNVV